MILVQYIWLDGVLRLACTEKTSFFFFFGVLNWVMNRILEMVMTSAAAKRQLIVKDSLLFCAWCKLWFIMISNNGFEISWIVFNDSKPVEPDRLFECLPDSLRPSSSGSPRNHGDGSGKSLMDHQEKSLENAVYTLPILIPPRVLPLLHDLAQQMAQAGHQQQLFRIYR